MQCLGHGRHQPGGFIMRQQRSPQSRMQIRAVDVLRDDIAGILGRAADVMDGNDVGVMQAGDGPCLGEIRFGIGAPGNEGGVRHLDGDGTPELIIVCQIDEPEPP